MVDKRKIYKFYGPKGEKRCLTEKMTYFQMNEIKIRYMKRVNNPKITLVLDEKRQTKKFTSTFFASIIYKLLAISCDCGLCVD